MYGSGQGVKQNKSKAKKLFGDVCDMGYQGGVMIIGIKRSWCAVRTR